MKYMKLGSKPDIFRTNNNVRTTSSDLASDFTIQVQDNVFHLHKFPLLSKCGRLQKLLAEAEAEAGDDDDADIIKIKEIPGGIDAFEFCAKFCYGITITLNAYNVMSVRCAAEYLGMTENYDKGNLVFKLEVFLTSSIFKSWKDSIIVLKTTKPLLPWSQESKMISRCIDSIASKTSVDPSKVEWSFTYTRKYPKNAAVVSGNNRNGNRHSFVPADWWVEDICDLDIDFFYRIMVSVKSKGRMSHQIIGEAVRVYAYRWLPGVSKEHNVLADGKDNGLHLETSTAKHKVLLEKLVVLLPNEKGSCSCSFMLKLLKAATILGVDEALKMELAKRIGLQLNEASLNDILIPSLSYSNDALYDVDLVQFILDHFLMQDQSPSCSPCNGNGNGNTVERRDYEKRRSRSRSADHLDFIEGHDSPKTQASKLKVAKLIDGYLAEIARDANLPLEKFINLAETVPEYARPVHDGLYRAIDIYLKEHPDLPKGEKKKICRLMDCKKLSMDACMHAAQNERLPLRVVVQVLFFEQVRTAMAGGILLTDLPNNIKALLPQAESTSSDGHNEDAIVPVNTNPHEEDWDSVHDDFKAIKADAAAEVKRKLTVADIAKDSSVPSQEVAFIVKPSKTKNLISNSKKILNRILSVKHASSAGSKDSDISKSSGSSVSSIPSKVDVANSAAAKTLRRRRHSIS